MRSLMEAAMAYLPYEPAPVALACGRGVGGLVLAKPVCGVSIFRAGMPLDAALQATVKDASLGKILIQTNPVSGNPELHFCQLPRGIKTMSVVLLDATVATGAAGAGGAPGTRPAPPPAHHRRPQP
jgi:uridine kinase